MKKFLVAGIAAAAFCGAPVPAAEAADPGGWFGYLEGAFLSGTDTGSQEFPFTRTRHFQTARTGDGWDGGGKLGYRFNGPWDIAVGGSYFHQSGGFAEPAVGGTFGWQFLSGKYWNADFEVGNTTGGKDGKVRVFYGARYQDYKANFTDQTAPVFATTETSHGLGPRAGLEVSKPVWGNISMFGGIDGAILFGKISDQKNATWIAGGNLNGSNGRTFYDTSAKVGVDWALTPLAHFAVGYKAEWLGGIGYNTLAVVGGGPSGRASELIHGPFARLSVNY